MKMKELRGKAASEMNKILAEARIELRGLRSKALAQDVKNVRAMRHARKTIAQVLTQLNGSKN